MKNKLLVALSIALISVACGTENSVSEIASPLSAVPESVMISISANNISGMVNNIDGYIEEGTPLIGQDFLENLICNELDISSFDEIPVNYGIDPSGQIVFWMENATPQSMCLAASVTDFDLLLGLIEETGKELKAEEPVNSILVYSFEAEGGTKYLAGTHGVLLVAASSASLETMINNLSSERNLEIESTTTSLTITVNLAMIGPMAVAQMPMARMMMTQGMASDSTMPDFVPSIMNVYLDGIEALLTQTNLLKITLIADTEDFIVKKQVSFLPDSKLAEILVPTGGRDMLQLITQGDVATVRYQMPPELSVTISKAFAEVFVSDLNDDILEFWSKVTSNAALSLYSDSFMHMLIAYETDGSITVNQLAEMYSQYFDVLLPVFQQNELIANAFTMEDNGIIQLDGIDFYSISMSIFPDSSAAINYDYWLTIYDDALLIETAPQPDILLDIIGGNYVPATLTGTGNMAGEMSLAGYIKLIMAMSFNGVELPEIDTDATISWNSSVENDIFDFEMSFDGSDAVATGFILVGLIKGNL